MTTEIQNVMVGLNNASGFELAQRAAKLLSSSTLVPKDYQGAVGMPNCVIALNMASRMGADPLMVMQNLVVVHGRPTWSSQFLIATFNSCGRYSSMRYEFFGDKNTDEYGCRAVAIELSTGEKLTGTDVTIGIAKAEGWYGRNGSKWKTMPQQMLTYRAACWFVRAYAPELSMGLHSQEEVIDIADYKDITPKNSSGKNVDDLIAESIDSESTIVDEPTPEKKTRKPKVKEPAFISAGDWEQRIKDASSKDELLQLIDETPELVQIENGDLIDSKLDSFEEPPPVDFYASLRRQIAECPDIVAISGLYRGLSTEVKAIVADDIRKRQDEIKEQAHE